MHTENNNSPRAAGEAASTLTINLQLAAKRFDLLADGFEMRGQSPFARHLRKYAAEARGAIAAAKGGQS